MSVLPSPTRIEVATAAGAYPVIIGAGTLAALPRLLNDAGLGPRRLLVSSPIVWGLHQRRLAALGDDEPILIPDGERFKTLATVSRVYEGLLQRQADRGTVIIAAGGGVVGDLVGFAAATFLRGLRLVHVPTTLMAQVDSAVGGKVGVNHSQGKNLIGSFHPPRAVVVDTQMLATLPRREFRAGLYEVVKYGMIASPALLDSIESSLPAIFARDPTVLDRVVSESCRIKAAVVSADERESGLRRVLNFGHTVGHALEAVTKYRRFRHGEAVAYGMLAAMSLGVARGVSSADDARRLAGLVAALGPLPPVADLSVSDVAAAVVRDKKVIDGTLHFVAVPQIGRTQTLTDVTDRQLKSAIRRIGITRK